MGRLRAGDGPELEGPCGTEAKQAVQGTPVTNAEVRTLLCSKQGSTGVGNREVDQRQDLCSHSCSTSVALVWGLLGLSFSHSSSLEPSFFAMA